jgi:hypothetical protein
VESKSKLLNNKATGSILSEAFKRGFFSLVFVVVGWVLLMIHKLENWLARKGFF